MSSPEAAVVRSTVAAAAFAVTFVATGALAPGSNTGPFVPSVGVWVGAGAGSADCFAPWAVPAHKPGFASGFHALVTGFASWASYVASHICGLSIAATVSPFFVTSFATSPPPVASGALATTPWLVAALPDAASPVTRFNASGSVGLDFTTKNCSTPVPVTWTTMSTPGCTSAYVARGPATVGAGRSPG